MELWQIVDNIGLVSVVGAVVWLIRLEGKVKRNCEKLERLSGLEEQTNEQEVCISQRDEEMKALKHSLDEVKDRMEKLENKQMETGERLSSMDAKLDMLLTMQGKLPAN